MFIFLSITYVFQAIAPGLTGLVNFRCTAGLPNIGRKAQHSKISGLLCSFKKGLCIC